MTPIDKSARRFAAALLQRRSRRGDSQAMPEDAQYVLAGLAQHREPRARDWAMAVERATARRLRWQRVARAITLVLLAAGVLGVGGYAVATYGVPWVRGIIAARQEEPTPTEAPPTETPTLAPEKAPWAFGGHVYRLGTQEGLEGAAVYLDVLSDSEWQEGRASGTSDAGGSFSITLPEEFEGKERYRLRVQPPSGWNHIEQVRVDGWEWSNTVPFVVEGTFSSGEAIEAATFEVGIRRTFAGTVYFEGEGAPESATVQLRRLDEAGNWFPVSERQVDRPSVDSPQQIPSAEFTLEHKSISQDDQYQILIDPPTEAETQSWAAGSPETGPVEGSIVIMAPGLETAVQEIVFAGPLPIRLSYETAIFDPPYDPENPGAWRDEFVPDEVTYPFATREDNTVPPGMRARWPVYLPGGNGNAYEIWVATPGLRSSAVVSYALHTDIDGQPGLQIPGEIEEVVQCRNDETDDEVIRAATYSPEEIGASGFFWLLVDESQARWPEGCTAPNGVDYQFRMPVWYVEVRQRDEG